MLRAFGTEAYPTLLEKAAALGLSHSTITSTLSTAWAGQYVDDFIDRGRVKRVYVQADAPFRMVPEDFLRWSVRNDQGQMVPLSAIMTVQPTFGPGAVTRYNGFFAADINGAPKPGISSGQAQAEMEKILAETLPRGISYEWTELVYQEKIAGNTMVFIFPLCVLLVFLVLAAQYESWSLPLAVILIVPMTMLSALLDQVRARQDLAPAEAAAPTHDTDVRVVFDAAAL